MDKLIAFQVEINNLIRKGLLNFKKSPKERITLFYVETRLENLELQWKQFYEGHRTLVSESSKEDLNKTKYMIDDVFDSTQESYFEYRSLLKQKLSEFPPASKASTSDGTSSGLLSSGVVKLPKITIPQFSGDYNEWTTFKDLFLCLVHNNVALDDVQKLHYLKTHLSGEAEKIVRHIPITASNYSVCWTQLKNRYDNKRYLSTHILKRLFYQKSLQSESATAIKELLDTITECLSALQNLGIDVSTWDIIIIFLMSSKLDSESRKLWEAKSSELNTELPTLSNFKDFLEHRFRSLEFLDTKSKPKQGKATVLHVNESCVVNEANLACCPFCKGNHKLCNCKLFSKENVESRREFIQTNRLCFNCLGANHSVFGCKQTSRCRVCKKKHHSLLHSQASPIKPNESGAVGNKVSVNSTTADNQIETGQVESESVVTYFSSSHNQILLATALVNVESKQGTEITLRCLLDQESQASFITESAVQALGLQKVPTKLVISGIGGDASTSLNSRSVVLIKMRSLYDPTFVIEAKVHVLSKLTTLLPSRRVIKMWPEIGKLKLADPKFDVPDKIDLLLGAELFAQIVENGIIKGQTQNTKLGWILSGQIKSDQVSNTSKCNTVLSFHLQADENELLRKFWELESEPSASTSKVILTDEEKQCEAIFANTTVRDNSGRYIVKLPFRDEDPKCQYGNSREIAKRRLCLLKKKLSKDSDLKQKYTAVMKEYLELHHMEMVPVEEINNEKAVYLPHHAVVREDKTTTKVRVVFDASCLDMNGVSLNQDLMIGPSLQPDLRHLVMRWRIWPICLIADIVKMYRQVKVCKADTDFQRILWHDEDGNVQHYRLLRVTFGTASATYLAVRALQQLGRDEGQHMQSASERILRDFYMDDLMSGCETIEEGKQIYEDINEIMSKGGFQLQKWGSNSKKLLEETGEVKEKIEGRLDLCTEKGKENFTKVLGLRWNSDSDQFVYSIQLPPTTIPITKRKVISDISRLFDPLGWVAPVIITAKILIQKIWISGIDWDDELPPMLLHEWNAFRSKLTKITGFSIPRWICSNQNDEILEIHGFSDASNVAYAAAVFVRVVKENGEVHVNLISSKTKVSPVKQISIPRLELCGAGLLAKLLLEVAETLSVSLDRVHAWTDSTVVLAWLSSHPSRWKPFVGNRVSEIVTHFDRSHWSHVKSQDNPADCASRGVSPEELKALTIWKTGPSWLHERIINPQDVSSENRKPWDTELEQRAKICCLETLPPSDTLIERFSSLRRLIRVIAWCRRFYLYRNGPKVKWLTAKELHEATNICIKKCQNDYFDDSMTSKKGKFSSLTPYKDSNGIWRVGGRLQMSSFEEGQKHPILIPRTSHLAKLIVDHAHEHTLHGGPQLMINFIRCKYWIVDLKNLVKSHIRRCTTCLRHSSQTKHPIMGQLPAARVNASRPFRKSGVDYAGPIAVRTTKGRGHRSSKGYICLFVCMVTRAIHLEVVSDLTSEAYLAAFKRFVARRGHCAELWSDNATTFVGAERQLHILLTEEKSSVAIEISDWLASNGTTWHRIPPYNPNFYGKLELSLQRITSKE